MNLSDILNHPLHDAMGADRLGRVEDVLIDLEGHRVPYLRIDLGSAFVHAPMLAHAKRLRGTAEDLRFAAPAAVIDRARTRASGRRVARNDMALYPEFTPGPLDYNGSPVLVAAALNALWQADPASRLVRPAHATGGWLWGQELLGRPVFGVTGELGHIRDVSFDPATERLLMLKIETDDREVLQLSAASLRHVPEKGGHLVADVDSQGRPHPAAWKPSIAAPGV